MQSSNPTFEFPRESLTPRKREILAWLQENRCIMRSLRAGEPRCLEAFRIYIPLHLSRVLRSKAAAQPTVFDLVRELFDFKYALEFVDSYPSNEDKYCLGPVEVRWSDPSR